MVPEDCREVKGRVFVFMRWKKLMSFIMLLCMILMDSSYKEKNCTTRDRDRDSELSEAMAMSKGERWYLEHTRKVLPLIKM